ncbi:hypothetical protein HDU86_006298 [Geranomyces michiganensis]|nr:hypothetical protein HDU86_006298 [Geranomyces michiganensis]
MSAARQQGAPCFSDVDCAVTGPTTKCLITTAGSVGQCIDPTRKFPSATPSATTASGVLGADGGGGGGGASAQTVIIIIAVVLIALAAALLLGWIARLKGIWPFHLLTRRDPDFEDESMYAQQPATTTTTPMEGQAKATVKRTRPEIDYRKSTLVPAPMASPLYQVDDGASPVMPLDGIKAAAAAVDHRHSHLYSIRTGSHASLGTTLRTGSHASLGTTLLALPPQEMLPPMPITDAFVKSPSSSSSSAKMSSAFPADQQRSATSTSASAPMHAVDPSRSPPPPPPPPPPLHYNPTGGERDSVVMQEVTAIFLIVNQLHSHRRSWWINVGWRWTRAEAAVHILRQELELQSEDAAYLTRAFQEMAPYLKYYAGRSLRNKRTSDMHVVGPFAKVPGQHNALNLFYGRSNYVTAYAGAGDLGERSCDCHAVLPFASVPFACSGPSLFYGEVMSIADQNERKRRMCTPEKAKKGKLVDFLYKLQGVEYGHGESSGPHTKTHESHAKDDLGYPTKTARAQYLEILASSGLPSSFSSRVLPIGIPFFQVLEMQIKFYVLVEFSPSLFATRCFTSVGFPKGPGDIQLVLRMCHAFLLIRNIIENTKRTLTELQESVETFEMDLSESDLEDMAPRARLRGIQTPVKPKGKVAGPPIVGFSNPTSVG